jgi:hypothetical protein
MGYNTDELRDLRARSVGTEIGQYHQTTTSSKLVTDLRIKSRLTDRDRAVLARFIDDMNEALSEAFRVLVPGGKAMYVLGENTLQGTYIRNSKIVEILAKQMGFVLKTRKSRSLPPSRRYLPPPSKRRRRAALDARIRREVVLLFVKPKHKRRRVQR